MNYKTRACARQAVASAAMFIMLYVFNNYYMQSFLARLKEQPEKKDPSTKPTIEPSFDLVGHVFIANTVQFVLGMAMIALIVLFVFSLVGMVYSIISGPMENAETSRTERTLGDVNTALVSNPGYDELLDLRSQLGRLSDSPEVVSTREEVARLIEAHELMKVRERLDPIAEETTARLQASDEIRSGDVWTSDIERQLECDRRDQPLPVIGRRQGGVLGPVVKRIKRQ